MNRQRLVSVVGVVGLALALPLLLRAVNSVTRWLTGAQGKLAAISIDTQRPLGPLPQPWRALAQGGDQLTTFLDSSSSQVAALAPSYIRIDHIYDGFDVVKREGGTLKFDWSRLDAQVTKIRSTGALPFFSLSYMPAAISQGDLTDPPRDWNEWALVVGKTIEHYSGDQGLAGVYYEVWNEPDLFGKWRIGGKKDYRQLYLYASRGAAAASGVLPFKLGGPGTTGLYKNWLEGFLPFVLANQLRLDFLSWHRYGLNLEQYFQDVVAVDRWLDNHPYFASVEKIISEMGPESTKGGANANRTGAAHLIASTRELLTKISYGFSFAVSGDWGIVGTPRYAALELLSRLGEQRLPVTGEGTWVRAIASLKGDTYQVLLVNYDPKGLHSEVVPATFTNLKQRNFRLRQVTLGGNVVQDHIATTTAILQRELPLSPNSAVLLELTPTD